MMTMAVVFAPARAQETNEEEIIVCFKRGVSYKILGRNEKSNRETVQTKHRKFDRLVNRSRVQSIELAYPRTEELKPSVYKEELLRTYRIKTDDASLRGKLKKYSEIIQVEDKAQTEEVQVTPNDYNQPWSSWWNTDWALDMIHAESAWDIDQGSSDIKIAITDLDYDTGHEDLATQIVLDGGGNPYTGDKCHWRNHGTVVGGMAAAQTNNAIGKAAIGYNSKLTVYRGLSYHKIVDAAIDGAAVINASWGSPSSYSSFNQNLINAAVNEGAIVVAASGNTNGNDPDVYFYPASYDNVISVAAVNEVKGYGCVPDCISGQIPSNSHIFIQNDKIDIAAPGVRVQSTSPGDIWNQNWNTAYNGNCVNTGGYEEHLTGTSFAAPIVAGTIGLMLSINPYLNTGEIENILETTGETISNLPDNIYLRDNFGANSKLLDAHAALQAVPPCVNESFSNITYTNSVTIDSNCGLTLNNITMNVGAIVTFNMSRGELNITGTFQTHPGAILTIQN